MLKYLFICFQYLVPQHLLSRAAGWLANTPIPWIKNPFIRWFVNHYNVNMEEAAETDPLAYPSFNEFFVRELKQGIRPICEEENSVVCPAFSRI